jgi:hypothetical protein
VTNTRPAHRSGGEDPVAIAGLGFDQAVGGHHDRAGEGGEVALLILPGTAVVADEVAVGVESGIAVGGQHFAVGIDVDPGALRIRAYPFENIQIEIVQTDHIWAEDVQVGVYTDGASLDDHFRNRCRRDELSWAAEGFGLQTGSAGSILVGGLRPVAHLDRGRYQPHEARRVEVDVRQCGEQVW